MNYIVSRLADEESLLLVNLNETKIDAFLFAEIIYNIKREVFIDVCYVEPHLKGVAKELLELVEKWARLNKIDTVSTLVPKDKAKVYERKYKFISSDVYLKKGVG
jgi:hypothetical protein